MLGRKKESASPDQAQGAETTSRRKPLVFVLVGVVSLLCLAGGVTLALGPSQVVGMLTGGTEEHADSDEHAPEEEEVAKDGHDDGHGGDESAGLTVLPMDEMIVNITATTATGRQTSRFLKLGLALVYDPAVPGAAQVEERMVYLRDSFQDYLRQLSERDLQGTMGLVSVKTELLRRARAISGSDAPQELLVSDLIVQ